MLSAYWFANFAVDYLKYLIIGFNIKFNYYFLAIISCLLLLAFGIDAFIDNDAYGPF